MKSNVNQACTAKTLVVDVRTTNIQFNKQITPTATSSMSCQGATFRDPGMTSLPSSGDLGIGLQIGGDAFSIYSKPLKG